MISHTIKQRLLASLLPPSPLEATSPRAAQLAESLTPDGSWADLLGEDRFSSQGSDGPEHLHRTLLLAQAVRGGENKLAEALRLALDFWLANDFQSTDWRQNQLIIPRLVGSAALLVDNDLSAGARGKVTEIMARARWQHWQLPTGWTDWTGTNLLRIAYNVILRGCVCDSPTVFDDAFARAFRVMRIVSEGEAGIQPDMTYRASASPPISNHEGLEYATDYARFIVLAHGTPWQAPADSVALLAAFLLDGQQWLMRNGVIDSLFCESSTSQHASSILNDLASVVVEMAQHGDTPRRSELAELSRRLRGKGEMLTGHRHFWRSGFSVHQRPAYYTSVNLTTSSAPAQDPGGDPASRASVAPAGSIRIMRSGAEYSGTVSPRTANGASGTTFVRDTTVTHDSMPVVSAPLGGGLSEGDYGLAALRIERAGLNATKSWFYFDQSFVCLGAGINATGSNHPVFTSINQCNLNTSVVGTADLAQARTLAPGSEYPMPRVRRVAHDGITYHFLQPSRVIVQVGTPRSSGTTHAEDKEQFTLLLNHGLHPQDENYAYMVLPLGDDAAAKARIEEETGQIEVLANSPMLQAVRHRGLKLLGATFWQAGVVNLPGGGRVAANQPCVLLCQDAASTGKRLSIANLRREPTTVHVEFAGRCLCFELPGGLDAGRGINRSL